MFGYCNHLTKCKKVNAKVAEGIDLMKLALILRNALKEGKYSFTLQKGNFQKCRRIA